MSVKINNKLTFLDGDNIQFTRTSKDEATIKENIQFFEKENALIDNVLNVNMKPGFDSKRVENNILNSTSYNKKDESYYYKPFSESKSESTNLQTQMNPTTFVKTYGLCNTEDESNVSLYNESTNIYDVKNYFKDPEVDTVTFPYTFNTSQLNCLSSIISPFNIIDELNAMSLTTHPLTGIKSNVISSGIDSRNRAINIDTKLELKYDYSKNEYNNYSSEEYVTEPFTDQEYEELVIGRDSLIENNYAIISTLVNNQIVLKLDTNATSKSSILSNKVLFYSLDNVHIVPFKEKEPVITNKIKNTTTEEHKKITKYNGNFIHQSYGYDLDNSLNNQADSFAFLGELD